VTSEPFGLDRFKEAQKHNLHGALAEINAGAKRGHWIWYVFPQLAGLGSSAMARTYGIAGIVEARAYLSDPMLRQRLLDITNAVDAQLKRGVPLTRLMGSEIDAVKLVSSLTLFEDVARRLSASETDADYRDLAERARAVLDAAESQGYPRCQFTLDRIRSAR
jgi:uncharacterized protein (DUF1810 family)